MIWLDCIAYDRRLKSADFRVAFVILQHTNEKTGECFPSEKTIADRCGGLSIRHVRRSLERLCKTEWLERKRRHNNSTLYTPLYGNVNRILDDMTVANDARREAA